MNELPDFFLDYRERMALDTRWSDRVCSSDGDWSGKVYDFYFRIVDRLTSDVKKPFVINKSLVREDDTDIHKSLREALANALIHADYYGRQGVVIEKEFKKLKFSNPGGFRISVEDAISGGISDARNSRIFNMFSLINVGERSGMGLCDIYNRWTKYGYDRPIIKETINPDRITLTLQIETSDANYMYGANTEIGVKNGTYNKILEYIKVNSNASSSVISSALSIPLRTVQRSLMLLKNNGIIRNEGNRKKVSGWF